MGERCPPTTCSRDDFAGDEQNALAALYRRISEPCLAAVDSMKKAFRLPVPSAAATAELQLLSESRRVFHELSENILLLATLSSDSRLTEAFLNLGLELQVVAESREPTVSAAKEPVPDSSH